MSSQTVTATSASFPDAKPLQTYFQAAMCLRTQHLESTTRVATEGRPMEEGLPEEANAISKTAETLTVSRQNLNNQLSLVPRQRLSLFKLIPKRHGVWAPSYLPSEQHLESTTRAATEGTPMEDGLPEEANAISKTTETLTVSRQNLNNQSNSSINVTGARVAGRLLWVYKEQSSCAEVISG